MMPIKGEIWDANFDPVIGHEQAKIRPCVIISNNQMNSKLGLSIVVPLTSKAWYTPTGKLSPDMVEILAGECGLSKNSYTMAFQVRSVSHLRLLRKRGTLHTNKLQAVIRSVQDIINF